MTIKVYAIEKVVLFGDSLMAGYGLSNEHHLSVVLKESLISDGLNIEVINGSVSGSTSSGGLNRAEWTLSEIDIDLIKPYKNNPREIPMESVQKVMSSIREFGNNQPIVVDKDNVIVVGHTRWKALKQLGNKKAYIVCKKMF